GPPLPGRGLRPDSCALVLPFRELLDDLLVECGDVVRLAARDDALVDDDLLVDPVAARIADVGPEARPRGERAAAGETGFDEHPRAVADDAHRLALLREVAYEADRVLVQAQLIGVPAAAGDE